VTTGADRTGHTPAGLDQVWRSLPPAAGEMLEAQRLADWPGGPVLAAVDASGVRHLLIGLPQPAPIQPPRSSRGLHIDVRRLRTRQSGERTWMDLSCPEAAFHRLFSSLCDEILQTLAATTSPDPAPVISIIRRWRRFWTVPVEELSRDAQIGLLGELWLLTRWLPALTLDAVRAWVGPLGGRHDFACSEISVEVKTSGASSGPTLHRIQSLDQLADPVVGTLCLLSLRFIADPLGQISLDNLVNEARDLGATDDIIADELDQRLAGARWTPADSGRYGTTWRIARQALYEVRSDFPRLTQDSFPSRIPSGVTDIGYTLDTSVCNQWLVEEGPSDGSRIATLAGHR
jgi:hypothetical protein